jgi:hypothetical protein
MFLVAIAALQKIKAEPALIAMSTPLTTNVNIAYIATERDRNESNS